MLPSLPFADLLNNPSELWVMFNSPAVTAVDPHGKLDFFFLPPPPTFVRIVPRAGEEKRDVGCTGLQR